jgi:predicted small secreted protein
MLRKLLLSSFAAAALLGFTAGCDNDRGAGDAIEEAGEDIQDAAKDAAD